MRYRLLLLALSAAGCPSSPSRLSTTPIRRATTRRVIRPATTERPPSTIPRRHTSLITAHRRHIAHRQHTPHHRYTRRRQTTAPPIAAHRINSSPAPDRHIAERRPPQPIRRSQLPQVRLIGFGFAARSPRSPLRVGTLLDFYNQRHPQLGVAPVLVGIDALRSNSRLVL